MAGKLWYHHSLKICEDFEQSIYKELLNHKYIVDNSFTAF